MCKPTCRIGVTAATLFAWGQAAAAAPLDLDAAVALAIEKNPEAKVAASRVAKARALARQAQAAFWPQAEVEASYTVTDNPARGFSFILNQRAFSPDIDFNDVGAVDDLGARATVEVPVFTGLRRFAESDAAERGLRASKAGAKAVRRELAIEAARAWLGVQKARASIDAAAAGVRAFEGNLEIAKRRQEAGTLLMQSVLEIETRLARARERLARARNGETLALAGLRAVLGLRAGTPVDVAEPTPIPVPEGGLEPETRPELAAARLAAEAAEKKVEAAKAGWLPKVGLTGSIGYDRGFIEDGDSVWYVAGLGISWAIWDGFLTAGKVDAARAEAARARAEGERLRIGLDLALERARIALKDAMTRVEVSSQAVELATRSADLARARFEEGAALPTQLVDAESELLAARLRNVDARTDRDIAALELRRALGLEPLPASGEKR